MAKIKAPLLSMRASGTIGKNITFGAWRGVPYARQHVVPANPQTAGQTLTRNTFKFLNLLFRAYGALAIAPWEAASVGRPFTGRNANIKSNLFNMRLAVDLSSLIGSPGVAGGPAMAAFNPAAAVVNTEIDVDFTVGTLPTGWTVDGVVAFAVQNNNPQDLDPPTVTEGEYIGVDPQTLTLAGLLAASEYAVVGWVRYLRDDGTLAYSPSDIGIVTTAA